MRPIGLYSIEGPALSPTGFAQRRITVDGGLLSRETAKTDVWRLPPDHLLIPAFHDHHTHLLGACRPPRGPDLEACRSREESLESVARWLGEHPGKWPVIGEGWDQSTWPDPRPLTRAELDRIAPDRPVALRRVCGHLAVANSAAWADLDPRGEEADPETGILLESLALGLAQRWPARVEDDIEGARRAQETAFRHGVTAIDEMGRGETFRAFRKIEEEGALRLRVNHYFPLAEVRDLIGDGRTPGAQRGRELRIAGLKAFLDGSIGARTAAMAEPYADGSAPGRLLWETGRLAGLVEEGVRAGFSIALHAIGLRAIEQALDVFEGARRYCRPPITLRIEHAEELDDAAIARASRAGVLFSMQPNFTARWQGAEGLYVRALGSRRGLSLNRYASAGARTRVLFGSDTMPFGPLAGLQGALGHPLPGERLPIADALRAYASVGWGPGGTLDPLAPGEAADLAIVQAAGGNLFDAICDGSARIVWTAVAGRTVYTDPSAPLPAQPGEETG